MEAKWSKRQRERLVTATGGGERILEKDGHAAKHWFPSIAVLSDHVHDKSPSRPIPETSDRGARE